MIQHARRHSAPFQFGDESTAEAWFEACRQQAESQPFRFGVAPKVRIPHPKKNGFVLIQGDEVKEEWFERFTWQRLLKNGSILENPSLAPSPEPPEAA